MIMVPRGGYPRYIDPNCKPHEYSGNLCGCFGAELMCSSVGCGRDKFDDIHRVVRQSKPRITKSRDPDDSFPWEVRSGDWEWHRETWVEAMEIALNLKWFI